MNPSSSAVSFTEQAVEQYSNMVVQIALHHLRNPADAEDICQQVFLKLLQQDITELSNPEHLKSWLIRVTLNQCRDLWKSAWWKRTVPLTPSEDMIEPLSQSSVQVLEEIRRLPRNYRTVVYLYYYQGYSLPEISRLLNKKENTVRSQLTRARRQLKTLLSEE